MSHYLSLKCFVRSSRLKLVLLPLMGSLLLGSCSQNSVSTNGEQSSTTETATESATASVEDKDALLDKIAQSFPEKVVIPTYQELVSQSDQLLEAVTAFTADPNPTTLEAARQAWLTARNPWERSEAFAFGPATSLGYDGDLDDWPVNETDVKAVLDSNDELTQDYIASLQTTQKGFHTIEYLLFGLDSAKTAGDFSERDLALLQELTQAFDQTANALLESWQVGVEGNPPYKEVLATAGAPDNLAYPTANAAVAEIVQGIIGCLDEVAKEKIGEPLETQETLGLESRFSQSSLNDFLQNLGSAEIAYLGQSSSTDSNAEYSLSSLVAQSDPRLDTQIKQEFKAAIAALKAVPSPIETKLSEDEATEKLAQAQEKIESLRATFEDNVLPLVQS